MSGFILKLIAAVTMLIDHAGLMLFPSAGWMRAVGRLSMPLYAYLLAEGFRYTHDRLRYFWQIFLLGAACQLVYALAGYELLLGILIDFSIAIALMALAERAKRAVRESDRLWPLWGGALLAAVAAAYLLCLAVDVDYGICGILLPVWPSLFEKREHRLAAFAAGLLALCLSLGGNQWFSLLSLPLLLLYSGKPGRVRLKWFFYVFYPAHLAALAGVQWLMAR